MTGCAPTVTPLVCRCGAPLGATDGVRLWIGEATFSRPVSMRCKCGRSVKWLPADRVT